MAVVKEYEVEIPEGVTVTIAGSTVTIKGKKGELKDDFKFKGVKIKQETKKITISIEDPKTAEKARLGTIAAHMKNMITGVTTGFEYKLKVVYSHFPINVSVEKNRVVIKNFAGEKMPRYAEIIGTSKVDVKGQDITITGADVKTVSQTAANIERISKVKHKDRRVFQDGIYITQKGA